MTITAVHRRNIASVPACGRVAFFYDEEGAPEDRIEAQRITLPDGSKPKPGETMTCGACGAEIGPEVLDLLPGEWNVRAK